MSYWATTFDGLPERLSDVRQYAFKVLGDAPGMDDVVLVISELAANAIRHSASGYPGGSFTLHLAEAADAWHLRVDDMGGPSSPKPGRPDEDEEVGRGLHVVAALARTWGVFGDQNGRAVWAEVAFPVAKATVKLDRKEPSLSASVQPRYQTASRLPDWGRR